MRAGHWPRIVVSSCLAGLFIRLTGLFIRGLFVRLAGLFVSLAGFFGFLETKIAKLLEMRSFFPPHIILGVGKQRDLRNKFCQTVGNALYKLRKFFDYLNHVAVSKMYCATSS
jgi:hypothetical protein